MDAQHEINAHIFNILIKGMHNVEEYHTSFTFVIVSRYPPSC